MSTTIEKQGLERGVTTCAQQWKKCDMIKHDPAWMINDDKNLQDCGHPPPPGGDWSGLNTPVLSSYRKVTGTTINVLSSKHWKKFNSRQGEQGPH